MLLRLRASLTPAPIEAVAACPACAADVELAVAGDELLAAGRTGAPPRPLAVEGYALRWRLPTSEDLAEAARANTPAAAEAVLLRRCVAEVTGPDGPADADALPDTVRAALAEAMSVADPLAEVLVDLTCPSCGHAFTAELDVATVVWTEVDVRARRLLREVDELARAYGWAEHEVLALGEVRRAAYLTLARGGPR